MKTGEASSSMPLEVETLIRDTVLDVQRKGGRVVGVLGFSQGTRVVAGLLRGCEIVAAKGADEQWLAGLRFGVSVCGSYPPPLVPPCAAKLVDGAEEAVLGQKIRMPTLHLQGKQDEWEWAGKLLIEGYYEVGEGMSEVVEYDMGHHYPVNVEENERVRDWMLAAWERVLASERA
jgi:hypothetical protein